MLENHWADVWIGLSDLANEGTYVWVDDTPGIRFHCNFFSLFVIITPLGTYKGGEGVECKVSHSLFF